MNSFSKSDLQKLYRAPKDSHKGNNGRLLVIGGCELFHASIFWTADVASRIVDLVHFCSPAAENNDLVRVRSKERFWDGIVVDWKEIDKYVQEDDCIVIGPGMPRDEGLGTDEQPSAEIINTLLKKFHSKKWIVDGGALQEVDPSLLNENMIITPHLGEWHRLVNKITNNKYQISNYFDETCNFVKSISRKLSGVTILLKGIQGKDIVCQEDQLIVVEGGNQGLTKGGTGDVLAGLVGAFYCKNESFLSASAASYILKKSAEDLSSRMGIYYNTSDLVAQVPQTMAIELG